MCFIDKHTLDTKYDVYGNFYNLDYGNHVVKCRSLLEIRSKNCKNKKADAIVVMMNPGSSQPINSMPPTYFFNAIQLQGYVPVKLVLTEPDDTQYQIMRVMHNKNWSYVKVINLSDVRNTDSTAFCNYLPTLKLIDTNDLHSIFSIVRRNELYNVLNGDKIIVAWGVNTKLKYLINLALSSNYLSSRVGKPKNTYKVLKNYYYYHPQPRGNRAQKLWLKYILNNL